MSRAGYHDDMEDQWAMIRWRGAVDSAIRGERGQRLLRELADAMDAMPEKRLIAEELESDGDFCALGVVGKCRGIDMAVIDPEDADAVAKMFNIAPALAREIVYENDEMVDDWKWVDVEICGPMRTHFYERHKTSVRIPIDDVAERRWKHMREWVRKNIKESPAASLGGKD